MGNFPNFLCFRYMHYANKAFDYPSTAIQQLWIFILCVYIHINTYANA